LANTKQRGIDLEEDKLCLRCLKWKNKKHNFYKSYDKWHADGLQPFCKGCLEKDFDQDDLHSLWGILRKVDKPYYPETFQTAKDSKSKTLGKYFSVLNLNYPYDTYADSLFDKKNEQVFKDNPEQYNDENEEKKGFNPEDVEDVEFTKEEMEYLVDYWGAGYTKEEYTFLQKEYERLTSGYDSDSSYAMEMLFQEASHQRLTIKRKRENGDPVDKELKTFQELLGSANIKPSQETGANAAEQESFGTLLKKYENERPTPEPDPEWADVDGIKKYINVWFLGHLCKMLGIQNKYSEMYDEEIGKYTVDPPENDTPEEENDV